MQVPFTIPIPNGMLKRLAKADSSAVLYFEFLVVSKRRSSTSLTYLDDRGQGSQVYCDTTHSYSFSVNRGTSSVWCGYLEAEEVPDRPDL